jgi:hypothetical protein
MIRLAFGLTLLTCVLGCYTFRPPSGDSVVCVAVTGDAGVSFEGSYQWSDGKTDTCAGVIREHGGENRGPTTFHNGIPDNRRITALSLRSLSEKGKLCVVVKRNRLDRRSWNRVETVVFEGQASGEGAKIAFNLP